MKQWQSLFHLQHRKQCKARMLQSNRQPAYETVTTLSKLQNWSMTYLQLFGSMELILQQKQAAICSFEVIPGPTSDREIVQYNRHNSSTKIFKISFLCVVRVGQGQVKRREGRLGLVLAYRISKFIQRRSRQRPLSSTPKCEVPESRSRF